MNNKTPETNPRNDGLLAAGILLAASSVAYLLFIPLLRRIVPNRVFSSALAIPLQGLMLGVLLTAIALIKRGSRAVLPALITLICAVFLTGGAGFGYAATCNFNGHPSPANGVFLYATIAGGVIVLIAAIWLVAAIVVGLVRGDDGQDGRKNRRDFGEQK
ncbi:MAG TPA: hypothetical protein VKD70_08760 [Candidatus Acidoferrum sp.]|nr:hypothetical protein [Candidatus Acidoferrum sp.]